MSFFQQFVNYIPFMVLTIAPVSVVALLNIVGIIAKRKRTVTWLSLLTTAVACLCLLLHEQGGTAFSLAYVLVLFIIATFLSPVFWVREKTMDNIAETDKEKGELFEPSALSVLPLESNVIEEKQQPMPALNVEKEMNTDVQLQHVFQVLKRLQNMKLTAGDRLETDVIQNMLNVYQTKGKLSAEETRMLNNYLATLLKLMSKYSL